MVDISDQITGTDVVEAGDTGSEAVVDIQLLTTRVNQLIAEIAAAKLGESDLATLLSSMIRYGGVTQDIDCGGLFTLTAAKAPVNPTDVARLADLVLGAPPSSLPVTELDKGTATAGQKIVIDDLGNVVGRSELNLVSNFLRG